MAKKKTTKTNEEPEVIMQEEDSEVSTAERDTEIPPRHWNPKLELNEGEMDRLAAELRKFTQDWRNSRSQLEQELANWNDLVEGIVQQRDGPWENSSNLHLPLVMLHMLTVHTVLRKMLLELEPVGMYLTDDARQEVHDILGRVESFVQYKADNEMKLFDVLMDALWLTQRDGSVAIQVSWSRQIKRVVEYEHYTNPQFFVSEYPSPADAGMNKGEYNEALRTMSNESPVSLNVEKDKVIYNDPKPELIELNDFVTFPSTVVDEQLETCKGVGKRYWLNKHEIETQIEDGLFDEEPAKELLDTKGSSDHDNVRHWKNLAEGLSESEELPPFEFFEVIFSFRRDGSKRPIDILVNYCMNPFKIVSVSFWGNSSRHIHRLHLMRRANRPNGFSLVGMLEDMNLEVNTQHNQRNDSRSITNVPSFKARSGAKREIDQNNPDGFKFYPGKVFWLADPANDFVQNVVAPVDLGQSIQEEENLFRYAEAVIGDGQLQTGRESAADPNAPAAKTIALISQSNQRIEDYAKEFAKGMKRIYDIINELYYNYGDPIMKLRDPDLDIAGTQRSYEDQGLPIPRQIFKAPGMYVRINGAKVGLTKDQQFQKLLVFWNLFQNEPEMAHPVYRHNWKKRLMRLGFPEGGWQELIKSKQELDLDMLQRIQQEILRMVQEKMLPPEAAEPIRQNLQKLNSQSQGGQRRIRQPNVSPAGPRDIASTAKSISRKVSAVQGGGRNGSLP